VTVIAIDGPAGAGKSSVARSIATALGFRYIDTGAMYRKIALEVLDRGIEPGDDFAVEELARSLAPNLPGEIGPVSADGRLREAEVSTTASLVARNPGVRGALATRQRALAASADVVMEGRDIGTVIAPKAEVKLYLTATPEVRASRRRLQLHLPDDPRTIEAVEAAIAERDHADSVREHSPLKPASGAVVLDTSDHDLEAVVDHALQLIREELAKK
jgi:CMP/dCMP kinase